MENILKQSIASICERDRKKQHTGQTPIRLLSITALNSLPSFDSFSRAVICIWFYMI